MLTGLSLGGGGAAAAGACDVQDEEDVFVAFFKRLLTQPAEEGLEDSGRTARRTPEPPPPRAQQDEDASSEQASHPEAAPAGLRPPYRYMLIHILKNQLGGAASMKDVFQEVRESPSLLCLLEGETAIVPGRSYQKWQNGLYTAASRLCKKGLATAEPNAIIRLKELDGGTKLKLESFLISAGLKQAEEVSLEATVVSSQRYANDGFWAFQQETIHPFCSGIRLTKAGFGRWLAAYLKGWFSSTAGSGSQLLGLRVDGQTVFFLEPCGTAKGDRWVSSCQLKLWECASRATISSIFRGALDLGGEDSAAALFSSGDLDAFNERMNSLEWAWAPKDHRGAWVFRQEILDGCSKAAWTSCQQ